MSSRVWKNTRSQAGGRNYIRISSIISAYDARSSTALSNFRGSRISQWRRQSADLVLAVSALIFGNISDIVFERRALRR